MGHDDFKTSGLTYTKAAGVGKAAVAALLAARPGFAERADAEAVLDLLMNLTLAQWHFLLHSLVGARLGAVRTLAPGPARVRGQLSVSPAGQGCREGWWQGHMVAAGDSVCRCLHD